MMFIPFSVDHGHCYLKHTDCEVRKIFRDVGFYGKEEISATKQNKGMTLVHGLSHSNIPCTSNSLYNSLHKYNMHSI